jgi:hypothetical protein
VATWGGVGAGTGGRAELSAGDGVLVDWMGVWCGVAGVGVADGPVSALAGFRVGEFVVAAWAAAPDAAASLLGDGQGRLLRGASAGHGL